MQEYSFQQLEENHQTLLGKAEEALQNAFNPDSNFVVGCAIRTKQGKVYTGANVKLSSTGMVFCAEVAALLASNTDGERSISHVAVIARNGDKPLSEPNMPCGRCCQILSEYSQLAGAPITLIYSNTNKDRIVVEPITTFLPHPFASGIFRK